jgi:hypothetical protein
MSSSFTDSPLYLLRTYLPFIASGLLLRTYQLLICFIMTTSNIDERNWLLLLRFTFKSKFYLLMRSTDDSYFVQTWKFVRFKSGNVSEFEINFFRVES